MKSTRKSGANGQPLCGCRVLVSRAKKQAGALSSQLRDLGCDVIEIPFIEIRKPKSFRPLDCALENLKTYDWLILTSVNGVEALFDRMARKKLNASELRHLKIAAIGPATKSAIEKHGLAVSVTPKEYVAESVVSALAPARDREARVVGSSESRAGCDSARAADSGGNRRCDGSVRNSCAQVVSDKTALGSEE